MLFNSIHFLLFFPVVVVAYFALREAHRWKFLLAASLYFYMCWKPMYVGLVVACAGLNYLSGHLIHRSARKSVRLAALAVALLGSFGMLFCYKYLDFAGAVANDLFAALGLPWRSPAFNLLLPVGISFYTFQAVSYTIDLYRGQVEHASSFGRFLLFVTFFPQLVAGPIERTAALLPQFNRHAVFDEARVIEGLQLMAWGFFKKVAVADTLAGYVQTVYAHPASFSGAACLLATYFFAFQIYADFSGYSDIARGIARVLGFELMVNFRQPYMARSIPEFWQRWHISLSTWFRDYVYIPLGGNRASPAVWYRNVIVVFLVSGIWHGANYTFVVWGLLHGFYFLAWRWLAPRKTHTPSFAGAALQTILTFHLAALAWVFFRAASLSDAWALLVRVATDLNLLHPSVTLTTHDRVDLLICVAVVAAMEFGHWIRRRWNPAVELRSWPRAMRWVLYLAVTVTLYSFWRTEGVQFIYFQF